MKKFLLILSVGFSLYSCTSEVVIQRLNDISKLQSQLDSATLEFKKIDTAEVRENMEKAKSQLDYLERHYIDSQNFDLAKYCGVYEANFKLMRRTIGNYEKLDGQIAYTSSQLSHLYADIENGMVADSVYERYYSGEQKATQEIIANVAKLQEWETKSTKRFWGMVQPMDSIITDLQNRGYRD
jgi:predicted transcriptional regulator